MSDKNLSPDAIQTMQDAFNAILDTGLDEEMWITLLHHKTKLGRANIKKILHAVFDLERTILKNLERRHGT